MGRTILELCGGRRRSVLCALISALALLTACPDRADREAKARIFSPEPQRSSSAEAARVPIAVASLARDPEMARRALTMGGEEMAWRVGPHRLEATASFSWEMEGARAVKLSEKRLVEHGEGRALRLLMENDRDQGYELLRTAGRTYLRSRYQPFRERARDRGQTEQLLEELTGGLASMVRLVGARVALADGGTVKLEGRDAHRFTLGLAKEPLFSLEETGARGALPPILYPSGGPDAQTQRRLDFATQRTPKALAGELWLDSKTGVPLKVELTAEFALNVPPRAKEPPKSAPRRPAPPSTTDEEADAGAAPESDAGAALPEPPEERSELPRSASLTVKLSQSMDSIGKPAKLAPPKESLPDEGRPGGIAAALERFGYSPRGDAGTPPPAQQEAPSDEPEAEPDPAPEAN